MPLANNKSFKQLHCPENYLPTGIMEIPSDSIRIPYTVHTLSATNMIITIEPNTLASLTVSLPIYSSLKLPFVGIVSVKLMTRGMDVYSIDNKKQLIMEVSFIKPDFIFTRALEKYFINTFENINEQELKSAGFKTSGRPTQCVFKRTEGQIEVMNKDKIISNIKISFDDDTLDVHSIIMERGFDIQEFVTEITAYFIKTAVKLNKRYVALPTCPDTPLGKVDIYEAALGRNVGFRSWKKLFSQWTDYVVTENLIKLTTKDKLRIYTYETISLKL